VDDPNTLLVHVTHFNQLMWDNGRTPTQVIEHGVVVPQDVHYTGQLNRGIVVINGLRGRGRRAGADLFEQARQELPLDLVGMKSEEAGGLGEIAHDRLHAFAARYRFFFNPIRYTSLGLAVCEAMMIGMPIIGLATTEMATAIENGVSGYVSTNVAWLVERMKELLADPDEARRLGAGARCTAQKRFNIERSARDWSETFALVTAMRERSSVY
jgi:glycosyltransferase involved in cell wall biosynthesis